MSQILASTSVRPALAWPVADQRRPAATLRRRHPSRTRLPSAVATTSFEVGRDPTEDAELRKAIPFHFAFPVADIKEARAFYGDVLGCPEGRSADTWVDFNFYGHQIVCHEVKGFNASETANAVDGDPVPVPHFGLAMSVEGFHELADRVRAAGIQFVIEPHIRFEGAPGEQWTMFFRDPSGNSLEFKAMTSPGNLFARYHVSP